VSEKQSLARLVYEYVWQRSTSGSFAPALSAA
jgi:hypothetical protein